MKKLLFASIMMLGGGYAFGQTLDSTATETLLNQYQKIAYRTFDSIADQQHKENKIKSEIEYLKIEGLSGVYKSTLNYYIILSKRDLKNKPKSKAEIIEALNGQLKERFPELPTSLYTDLVKL